MVLPGEFAERLLDFFIGRSPFNPACGRTTPCWAISGTIVRTPNSLAF